MPPKKKPESTSKKPNYAAQSPKQNCDFDNVDDILINVEQFIEEVYRDLSMTTPTTPSLNAPTRTRNALNTAIILTGPLDESSTSASSSASPVGAIGGALSPTSSNDHSRGSSADCSISSFRSPARRNMDVEIERINRVVENTVENLRSNGISMNMSFDYKNTSTEENRSQTDTMGNISSPISSTATPLSTLSLNSSPEITAEQRAQNISATTTTAEQRTRSLNDDDHDNNANESGPRPSYVASQVIDLCESQTQTPEVLRQPFHWQNQQEDDDDVVIVSSNLAPVIDLCTPGHMVPPIRRTIEHEQLNRRRLAETMDDVVPTKKPTPEKKERNKSQNSSTTASTGATPFMCAICMESCIQRQPTSTKCGHVFCGECINTAARVSRKCPLCNTKITHKNHLFRIYL